MIHGIPKRLNYTISYVKTIISMEPLQPSQVGLISIQTSLQCFCDTKQKDTELYFIVIHKKPIIETTAIEILH